MKVALIGSPLYNRRIWPAAHFGKRMRYFPGIIYECTTLDSIKKWVPQVDIVLLDNNIFRGYLSTEDIEWFNNLHKYTAQIHLDPDKFCISEVNRDAIVTAANTYLRKGVKNFPIRFWSPACAKLYDYNSIANRDIDILCYGNSKTKYPFRTFMRNTILEHCTNQKDIDRGVSSFDLNLGSKIYKVEILWGVPKVSNKYDKYYSFLLYEKLCRSKICLTGNHHIKIPLGKHFESAACGALNVCDEFTDKELLGFEHEKNIWFTDKDNFLVDIQYLLEHPNIISDLSKSAWELIKDRHTVDIRAKELYTFFESQIGVS